MNFAKINEINKRKKNAYSTNEIDYNYYIIKERKKI